MTLTYPQRRWGDIAKRQFPKSTCYPDDARDRSERYVALACENIAAFERGRDHTWSQIECADWPARGTHFYDPKGPT